MCLSVCMYAYLPSAGLGLVAGLPEALPPDLPLELRLVTNTSTHLSKNWATTWNKQQYTYSHLQKHFLIYNIHTTTLHTVYTSIVLLVCAYNIAFIASI